MSNYFKDPKITVTGQPYKSSIVASYDPQPGQKPLIMHSDESYVAVKEIALELRSALEKIYGSWNNQVDTDKPSNRKIGNLVCIALNNSRGLK